MQLRPPLGAFSFGGLMLKQKKPGRGRPGFSVNRTQRGGDRGREKAALYLHNC